MDLRMVQRDAWDCTEEKGLHGNLHEGGTFSLREAALESIGALYDAVTQLAQHIKRHGVSVLYDKDVIKMTIDIVSRAREVQIDCLASVKQEAICVPAPRLAVTQQRAAAVRLCLIHTEVDECRRSRRVVGGQFGRCG